jgi:hypothetical protein
MAKVTIKNESEKTILVKRENGADVENVSVASGDTLECEVDADNRITEISAIDDDTDASKSETDGDKEAKN